VSKRLSLAHGRTINPSILDPLLIEMGRSRSKSRAKILVIFACLLASMYRVSGRGTSPTTELIAHFTMMMLGTRRDVCARV
jgi:hypothetical protein